VLDDLFKLGERRFEFQLSHACCCRASGFYVDRSLRVCSWHFKGSNQTGENSLLVGFRSNGKLAAQDVRSTDDTLL
ncbi:MAG TPA: hypothetical protein PLL14_10400, partial [Accumulibacter sp.]|nr:hypothetical protein [Accumulibacter sp.]